MNPIDAFSYPTSPTSPEFSFRHDQANGASSSEPEHANSNLIFSKTSDAKLSARIRGIFYINEYGQEIFPYPNPKLPAQLATKRTLIYSIGSLYTSILPCLILCSVGNAIATSPSLRHKVLILNGTNDRETDGYTALDFIKAITDGLNASRLIDARRTFYNTLGEEALNGNGTSGGNGGPLGQPATGLGRAPNAAALSPPTVAWDGQSRPNTPPVYPAFPSNLFVPNPASAYMTHLVYLSNSGVAVDEAAVEALGVQCVKCEGGWDEDGRAVYAEDRLTEVLETIIKS